MAKKQCTDSHIKHEENLERNSTTAGTKEDNEKRENNLVLFNVPESKLETPKEKKSEDLQVFHQFCEEGLRIDLDENQIEKVIRIGKVRDEDS